MQPSNPREEREIDDGEKDERATDWLKGRGYDVIPVADAAALRTAAAKWARVEGLLLDFVAYPEGTLTKEEVTCQLVDIGRELFKAKFGREVSDAESP